MRYKNNKNVNFILFILFQYNWQINVVTLLSSVVVDFAAQVNKNFARFFMFYVGTGIADGIIETIEC